MRISDEQTFLSAVGRVACLEVNTGDNLIRRAAPRTGKSLLLRIEIVFAKEAMMYSRPLRKTSRLILTPSGGMQKKDCSADLLRQSSPGVGRPAGVSFKGKPPYPATGGRKRGNPT